MSSTDMMQLTFTLKMTTAQVIETSFAVNNYSPIHNYAQPDSHELTHGFNPFTEREKKRENKLVGEINYSFKAVPLITFNLLRIE